MDQRVEELELKKMKETPKEDEHKFEEDELDGTPVIKRLPTKQCKPIKAIDFVKAVYSHNSETVARNILRQIRHLSEQVKHIWKRYLWLVGMEQKRVLHTLYIQHLDEQKRGFSRFFVRSELAKPAAETIAEWAKRDMAGIHKDLTKKLRLNMILESFEDIPVFLILSQEQVQDEGVLGKVEEMPIVFEDVHVPHAQELIPPLGRIEERSDSEPSESPLSAAISVDSLRIEEKKGDLRRPLSGRQLFVLVHGFQGTSYDMKTIRNHLLLRYPDAHFLVSTNNENSTEGEIEEMGIKLACEVTKCIKRQFRDLSTLSNIIFIGHSLGGIIIRAALPLLEEYKNKMRTLITFSSPHLGCYYQSSTLINAGLWFMQKWNKSKCLDQLLLRDSEDPKACFLYKLAEKPGLNWFENVILVSSYQDSYAPYESAKIELAKQALEDSVYFFKQN
eukprot:TRINITY_DN135085_c0_g1_i1.p1 TRINITY_DN135085_c0_g1~~TRINITY_DN135085_c0_g1_i1.p1  ORF type:complete len:447 (+),score=43.19 TRINITY_DN135085_c0_g1_i1:1032-2372(+)